MSRLSEDEAEALLLAAGAVRAPTAEADWGAAVAALSAVPEPAALAVLFALPDPPSVPLVAEWLAMRFPPPLAPSVRRWDAYAQGVRRRLAEEDDAGADAPQQQQQQQRVFGVCVRCGSHRLIVTTRQLRRADEGATELRNCRDCGHTSRVNS